MKIEYLIFVVYCQFYLFSLLYLMKWRKEQDPSSCPSEN
ncbi:hypothetical protein D1BOALGB6SA_10373 [Olavius sp. associated proteobacterium Delta 1]|nr:hypothetical protein D1BOALGB6SA_10373 [Olavius sp. associated proteobacterium Delta 1]